jgi:transposase-like protein
MEGKFMSSKLSEEKKAIIGNLIETYEIRTAKDIQEALKDLLGGTIQEMLESELTEELGHERYEQTSGAKTNYRNGHKSKHIKTTVGELEIAIPQDRNSEFEPKIVPKHKCDISEIEQKIINMYGKRNLRFL